jgi:hypothetical protein
MGPKKNQTTKWNEEEVEEFKEKMVELESMMEDESFFTEIFETLKNDNDVVSDSKMDDALREVSSKFNFDDTATLDDIKLIKESTKGAKAVDLDLGKFIQEMKYVMKATKNVQQNIFTKNT